MLLYVKKIMKLTLLTNAEPNDLNLLTLEYYCFILTKKES